MCYDLHGSWKPKLADHHAPLYRRSWDTTPFKTVAEGYIAYFEICEALQKNGWKVTEDPNQINGPYTVSTASAVGSQIWVGYDDVSMVTKKSNYLVSRGLGGAMVWEVSLDDYRGSCGAGKNPLIKAISRIVVA